MIVGWGISSEIALRWMSLDLTTDKSALVQVMAWCQHYRSQDWPIYMSTFGITRQQWVNLVEFISIPLCLANFVGLTTLIQASKFQIECACPSGKWIVKITFPNVPFTCLKYTKPMQLMWKSEICSHPSDAIPEGIPLVRLSFLLVSDDRTSEPCHSFENVTFG